MILHIENKIPLSCVKFLNNNASLLLLQDAVYALLQDDLILKLLAKNIVIYALEDEIISNNIKTNMLAKINIINYDGFVKLVEDHDKSYSW